MGLFDAKKDAKTMLPPAAAECDREMAALGQRTRELYVNIGQRYAQEVSAAQVTGSPYEADLRELEMIAARGELLTKRRLAVQGLRKCENCGGVLPVDSMFCNKCGGKLNALEPEVFTDGPLCPQCKSPVAPGESFCTKCGARLDSPAPAAEMKASPEGLVCPTCGTICELGTRFCEKCGSKLAE